MMLNGNRKFLQFPENEKNITDIELYCKLLYHITALFTENQKNYSHTFFYIVSLRKRFLLTKHVYS